MIRGHRRRSRLHFQTESSGARTVLPTSGQRFLQFLRPWTENLRLPSLRIVVSGVSIGSETSSLSVLCTGWITTSLLTGLYNWDQFGIFSVRSKTCPKT